MTNETIHRQPTYTTTGAMTIPMQHRSNGTALRIVSRAPYTSTSHLAGGTPTSNRYAYVGWHENLQSNNIPSDVTTETLLVDSASDASQTLQQVHTTSPLSVAVDRYHSNFGHQRLNSNFLSGKFHSKANSTSEMAMLFPWTHYFANHRHPSFYQRLSTINPELSADDLLLVSPYDIHQNFSLDSEFGSGELAENDSLPTPQPMDWSGWELNFIMHGIIMPIIAIFGMLANFASFFILTRKAMRSAVVNTYLAALSAFDGLLLLIALLLYPPMSYCEYSGGSDPRSFWCQYFFNSSLFLYPLSLIAQTGSVWILTALTVDRFIAITWPLANRKWCTNKRAICVTICIFIWSILYNIPAFLELKLVKESFEFDERDQPLSFVTLLDRTDLRKNNTYILVYKGYCYLIFMLLLPAGTMIALNAYVATSVRHASRVRKRSMNVSNNPGRDDKERRCTIMAVLVVGTFLILNSLAFVNNMLEGFWNEKELAKTNFLTLVCVGNVLVALNSAINFFIYYALGLRFRQMFCKYFCPICYTPEREYQYLSVYYGSGRNFCWTNGGPAREMTTLGDPAATALLGGGIISMRTLSTGKGPRKVANRPGANQSVRTNISAPAMQQSGATSPRPTVTNQRNINAPQSAGIRISPPVDASALRTYQNPNRFDVQRSRSPGNEQL